MTDKPEVDNDLYSATFIVWVYRYSEGWTPYPFNDQESAVRAVMRGDFGGRCVITGKPYTITIGS